MRDASSIIVLTDWLLLMKHLPFSIKLHLSANIEQDFSASKRAINDSINYAHSRTGRIEKFLGQSLFSSARKKKWPSVNYLWFSILFIDRPEPVCTTQNEQRNVEQGFWKEHTISVQRELIQVRCNYEF